MRTLGILCVLAVMMIAVNYGIKNLAAVAQQGSEQIGPAVRAVQDKTVASKHSR